MMPSARTNRTYIMLEAKSRAEIEKVIVDYIGILGWARASPIFVEGGKSEGRFVLAINREEISNVRAAFAASALNIKILKASGTIKGLTK